MFPASWLLCWYMLSTPNAPLMGFKYTPYSGSMPIGNLAIPSFYLLYLAISGHFHSRNGHPGWFVAAFTYPYASIHPLFGYRFEFQLFSNYKYHYIDGYFSLCFVTFVKLNQVQKFSKNRKYFSKRQAFTSFPTWLPQVCRKCWPSSFNW